MSLNTKTYFGEDLRAYPESVEDFKASVDEQTRQLESLTGELKYKAQSRLAVHLGILKEHAKAHSLFAESAEYFASSSPLMTLINNIRWADIFRYQGQFVHAKDLLLKAEKILKEQGFTEYQDFYFQHFGKLEFDQGHLSEALVYFEKSLALRKIKADPELLASAEFALKITKGRIKP